ncbi:MAG: hypothetical protein ABIJ47_16080 [Candidatus Bathyarchaeota archaeon]
MSVGHGGEFSKHPANVKIAILRFIEARLKDAADYLEIPGITADNITIYDPFTTDMDFFIFFKDVGWENYLKIYSKYYDETFEGRERQAEVESDYKDMPKIISMLHGDRPNGVFNASRSKSVIYYTPEQMENILDHGDPY